MGFEGLPIDHANAHEVWEVEFSPTEPIDRHEFLAKIREHNQGAPIVITERFDEFNWGAESTSWLLEVCTMVGGVAGFAFLLEQAAAWWGASFEDERLSASQEHDFERLSTWAAAMLRTEVEEFEVEAAETSNGSTRVEVTCSRGRFELVREPSGAKRMRRLGSTSSSDS